MTESPHIRRESTAFIASELKDKNKLLRNALEVAQADDAHRYLTRCLEAGFLAANLADSFQAQLHQLVHTTDASLAEATMGRELVKTSTLQLHHARLALANTLEAKARDEVDFIATVIEQSQLAETDRAEQNFHAWLHMWQAHELRAKTLQAAVEDAEYDLRRVESAYQVALLTHQPADQIAEIEQTVAKLRPTLEGDPAAVARVQELLAERESLIQEQRRGNTLTILTILLPRGLQSNTINHKTITLRLDAIDQQVDTLMEQVGLRTRRDWAAADLARTTTLLDTAQLRLLEAASAHQDSIPVQSSMQRKYVAELKAKIAKRYSRGSPAYKALIELEAVLDTHDTALFTERYAAFADLMDEDKPLSMIVGNEFHHNGAFNNDPRLGILMGRISFARSIEQIPFETMIAHDGFLLRLLLGSPSLVRNTLIFNEEDISPEVRRQHLVGLKMDMVVTQASDVLQLIDQGIAQLRKAYGGG